MPSARKKHRSPGKTAKPRSASFSSNSNMAVIDQHPQPSSSRQKKKAASPSSQRNKKREVSPQHFNFASESRQPGTFHINSPRSEDADDVASYDSLNNVGVCQDEREGLAALLNCAALSPKEGDERADVVSEDEDDLFEFFEEDKKKMEALKENKEALSKEIAKSFSCCSGEEHEETPVKQKGVLSPVSLADDDVTDEDTATHTAGDTVEGNTYTDEDTAGDGTFTTYGEEETLEESLPTIEKASSKSKKSKSGKSKPSDDLEPKKAKKSVTIIQARDEVHEYTVVTPHNSGLRTNSDSMIPDDESEASMLVLMRYIGCTSTAYGEAKPVPVRVRVTMSEDRSYFGSESDDDTTISGWTQESFRMTRNGTYDEEGVELTIEEFLPPSMRLTRSVSVDEGIVLSGAAASVEDIASLVRSQSDPADDGCPSDEEISKRPLNENVGDDNKSSSSDEASIEPHKKPKQKTTKKDHSPIGAKKHVDKQKTECLKVDASASQKVTSQTASAKKPKRALAKQELDITVKTDSPVLERDTLVEQDRSPVTDKKSHTKQKTCLEVDASASQQVISPATMAKNFLTSTGDATSNSPVTSPATEAKNYLASSSKPSGLRATLVSTTTKGDETKAMSPASQAKAFLAHPSKTEPVVPHQSIAKSNLATSALLEIKTSTADEKKQGSAKKPAKKHPVDDLIQAYLSTPRNSKMDNDALISAMSPTTLKSPSVQMLLDSNLLSPSAKANSITPTGLVTPKANNVSPGPPKKKSELTRAPVKTTMTPIEKRLSNRNALPPIETYGSMTNMQINDINSPISPVSAISEGTNDDTINTDALISMARGRRGIVPSASDMSSVAKKPTPKEPPLFAAIDEGSNESSTKASKESSTTTEVSMTEKAAVTKKATPKASNVRIKSKQASQRKNKKSQRIVEKNKAADPPENSSSFDKNEITKENKRSLSPQNAIETSREMKEPVRVVASLDENARDPPPLTPCRQSVQEVDALLSKTRIWLAEHNRSKASNVNLGTKVDIQRKTTSNLTTSTSELTIREQLEALKARQTKDRTRQCMSKAMG